MTTQQIENQKNLIIACQERLKEVSREKGTLNARLEEISKHEEYIKNAIRDLEHLAVAEVDAEELFNELNAMDSNPQKIRNANPRFTIRRYPSISRYVKGEKIELSKLQEEFAEYLFNFEINIITKARTYALLSPYLGCDFIDYKPLYKYLQITKVSGNTSDRGGARVDLGFDENFIKTLKVKLPFSQIKTYPNLETAVMNILKRREAAQNV